MSLVVMVDYISKFCLMKRKGVRGGSTDKRVA